MTRLVLTSLAQSAGRHFRAAPPLVVVVALIVLAQMIHLALKH